jgi:hypothetical protein
VPLAETLADLLSIARTASGAAGYFPALYGRVTDRIAAAVGRGGFENTPQMEEFTVGFASYYTRAWRREVPPPRCWRASWDVAGDRRLLIVQHLLLGINAHVNYDLPQAVVDLARRRGSLAEIRSDFDAVNDILAATYEVVIDDLDRVSRWANEVASLGGSDAFNFSLRVARARAWNAAERLYSIDDPVDAAAYVAHLDHLVSVLAYIITEPAFPLSLLVRVARWLEEDDPQKVVAALTRTL